MSRKYVLAISTVLFIFFADILHAQNGIISLGDKASGSGGTVEYSIGQVIYVQGTGNSGTVNQGLQQPFIIQQVTGLDDSSINLVYRIYPNPTSDFILLTVDENDVKEGSAYSVFNLNGELVQKGDIQAQKTSIPMKELRSGTYLIKAFINNQEAKTFRVIKN